MGPSVGVGPLPPTCMATMEPAGTDTVDIPELSTVNVVPPQVFPTIPLKLAQLYAQNLNRTSAASTHKFGGYFQIRDKKPTFTGEAFQASTG